MLAALVAVLAAAATAPHPALAAATPPRAGGAPTTYAAPPYAAALQVPASVVDALERGRFDATPGGFRIIALSHAADGCAARAGEDAAAARACIEQALLRARAIAPPGVYDELDDARARHGLYLTHLALILGAGDATGPCLDGPLHRRVATALARASREDPRGIAPSYPSSPQRWPADQAATLAALARFDRAHGATLLDDPRARYRATTTQLACVRPASSGSASSGASPADDVRAPCGLPWSEARGRGTGAHPRGCALSWSVRYLAEADPDLATTWWDAYRAAYLVDRGFVVGFREWPPGVDGKADDDSGPIVQGVGAAATAFGIAAARALDDDALAARLEATAAIVGAAAKTRPALRRHAESALADAIRFQAAAQPVLVDR